MTTDAEAFFFLHDLITSYMKEKERVRSMQLNASNEKKFGAASSKDGKKDSSSTSAASSSSSTAAAANSSATSPSDPNHSDWRRFECNTWHLEPTVRLISWAGSEIEPYGVDYILQRLGFAHARTTIPKWLQRGCMDPLDKAISIIVMRTIQLVQEEKKKRNTHELQQQQEEEQQHQLGIKRKK